MPSRQYIKRVGRVPKERGASAYLAALGGKALVKHGWPAMSLPMKWSDEGFYIAHVDGRVCEDLPDDMAAAVAVAVRIVARTHRLDVTENFGSVILKRRYIVTDGGFLREVKHDPTGES